MVGLTTNGQNLHVAAITWLSLVTKLKSDANGHALKATLDTLSCFADMLLHSFENADHFQFH